MNSSIGWILLAFAAYLLFMISIGAAYVKKTKSTEDFFLGGRGLTDGWLLFRHRHLI